MIDVRDNWRILLLVALCVLAALALFGPLGASDGETGLEENQTFSDPTNLQYGLELSGGSRVRGQLVGQTAENVEVTGDNQNEIERIVSEELGVEAIDVTARPNLNTVELFVDSENISADRFSNALNSAGLDTTSEDIRDGTTSDTRDDATEIISERIDRTGLAGSSVTTLASAGGEHFIVVEVPGETQDTVERLIGDPGRVQVIAGYPDDENQTEPIMEEVLTQDDFFRIRGADTGEAGPHVGVTLDEAARDHFAQRMVETGFTQNLGLCSFEMGDEPSPNEYCLYTVVDGEIRHGASMGGLATSLEQHLDGTQEWDGSFQINTGSMQEAQSLSVDLQAGALPTELRIESSSFISPSLAQMFKPLALLTAFVAWLSVCAMVYIWYRDIRVAIPMLVTASTEVFLLLGFAAAVGMALDLSHIAGFIAVIGTGLDDLIIMADEILQRKKKVKTGRVFQNRFRKAFIIIAMAAGTTIIAMSPLAVLSLGDLRGFAIVTIVGVLIGVGVTRPAYGDVLRHLILDDVKRTG